MFLLVFLAIFAAWLGIGLLLYIVAIGKFKHSIRTKWLALALFLPLWVVGPFLDEIVGAWQFSKLCSELPKTQVVKRILVGPGNLYDESGKRKFKTIAELGRLDPTLNAEIDRLQEVRTNEEILSGNILPIKKWTFQAVNRRTGEVVYEYFVLSHKGGMVRRTLYSESAESCKSAQPPLHEQTIEFSK